ncbi:MAG: hypothetical protein AB1450_14535 [Pseudomonadota bacterium]
MALLGPKADEYRTYAYRTFKSEFSNLNRLHWFFSYASRRVETEINSVSETIASTRFIGDILPANNFASKSLGITPAKFALEVDEHIEHLRLVLLVKACAAAEDFIHKYCQYWAISAGYVGHKQNKVNKIGNAIIAPAMISNIAKSTTYIEELTSASLGPKKGTLGPAYDLRCAAAHNGGIIDHEILKKVQFSGIDIGDRIKLGWHEFHRYIDAIFDVCSRIELIINPTTRHKVEVNWLLQDIFDRDPSLDATSARKILIDNYGYGSSPSSAPSKRKIAAIFNKPYS